MKILGQIIDPLMAKGAKAASATREQSLLFADKLTFGATPALVEEIESGGREAWLERQLAPETITEDPRLTAALATFPSNHGVGPAKRFTGELTEFALYEQQLTRLLRGTWSNRQLHEVMAAFWHDHFNIALLTGPMMWLASDYDAALRQHTLGRFSDLLVASAKTGAMMLYLNNNQSLWPNPNENYAREVMELHTVGVNGGYTEQDVKQAALALTGWGTTDLSNRDLDFGFAFNPDGHYQDGPIRVMDWHAETMTGPEAIAQGESLLDHLAHHPNTARFLSSKLVRRFLGDGDHGDLVDNLASVYLANDTQIVPWLRALIDSDAFATSSGSKLRRPFEHLVAALRALDPLMLPEGGRQSLLARGVGPLLTRLGHAPFTWASPDGFPDEDDYWVASGSVLARWNGLLQIMQGQIQGIRSTSVESYLPSLLEGTAEQAVDELTQRLLVRSLPDGDRAALVAFLEVDPATPARQVPAYKYQALSALILSTHTAQVR